MKISRQIKRFSIQALDSYRSVYMVAICYSGLISAVPTNEQRLGEKRTCAKFQIDISKTEGLVRIYADEQTDMAKSNQLVTLITYIHIYFVGSPFPFGCYKLRGKLNIPCAGYKNSQKLLKIFFMHPFRLSNRQ